MIRIYERSLCQSYASAYRAGIKIGEAETIEEGVSFLDAKERATLIATPRILEALAQKPLNRSVLVSGAVRTA